MKTNYIPMAITFLTLSIGLWSCNSGTKSADSESESEATIETTEPVEAALTGTVGLDMDQSQVQWKGEMMGMYAHEGTLKFSQGSLTLDDGQVTGGNFVVDMSSMTPTDENFNPEEGKTKEKLVGHLSSADFFDVETSPTASFTISNVDGSSATGTLQVRGKDGEESVENVSVSADGGLVTVSGTMKFDRKNYDVAFNHPMQEMVISDEVELAISLVGQMQ